MAFSEPGFRRQAESGTEIVAERFPKNGWTKNGWT